MILLATGIALSTAGFSQFSFGVQATGNMSTARLTTSDDINFSKTMRFSPGGGLVAQYALSDKLAIRSGINYLQNGGVFNYTDNDFIVTKVKVDNKLNYLQLPVNFMYKLPIGKLELYAGVGGYISYGLSGKTKITKSYTLPDGNHVTEEERDAFKDAEKNGAGFRKVDFGASALAGVKLKNGLFANIGYQFGLTDIASDTDTKYFNRSLQLHVGYLFALK